VTLAEWNALDVGDIIKSKNTGECEITKIREKGRYGLPNYYECRVLGRVFDENNRTCGASVPSLWTVVKYGDKKG
jgi:hypothetical protein